MLRGHPLLVGLAILALGLSLSATIAPAQPAAAKQEMKVLAGRWLEDSFDPKDPDNGAERLTFSTDGKVKLEYSVEVGWREFGPGSATFTVDPTKKPKTMDIGDALCIYEIKGNQLRLGQHKADDAGKQKRPIGFSDKDLIVKTYNRSK
jgi:uncharacterized protein (TIGR03067 family)